MISINHNPQPDLNPDSGARKLARKLLAGGVSEEDATKILEGYVEKVLEEDRQEAERNHESEGNR